MIVKNTWALGIIAFLLGIAANLGHIGAQSYLLSCVNAVYGVYCTLASGVIFSIILRVAPKLGLRHVHMCALIVGCFCAAQILLAADWLTGSTKALVWMLVAMFGVRTLRWIVNELALHYLDPARASAYASYVNAFLEGGTVIVVLFLRFKGIVLTPNQTLVVIFLTSLASLALMVVQFFPRRNLEVVFSRSKSDETEADSPALKGFFTVFTVATLCFGFIVTTEDYVVKVVLKDRLHSYAAIRAMTDSYYATSCACVVLLSVITGKAIHNYRVSPMRLLSGYAIMAMAMTVACFATNYLYLFVAFDVIRRVCEYCLYGAGNQMIMGSFVSRLRSKIRAIHSDNYFVGARTVSALVFSLTSRLPVAVEVTVVLGILFASATTALALTAVLRKAFTATLYEFVDSGLKSPAIMAAHTLSYIRPNDYVQRMCQILNGAPKKLLRKTIVLGLAYTRNRDTVQIIEQQFNSDKEEIQIAALDALRISRSMKAARFMLKILLEKAQTKTQRVRMNAMAAIAGLYGKKAVPFLLAGLEDEDPRVVANALEVLSHFRDEELIQQFLEFAESPVARIRANALIGLSRYRETRRVFEAVIRDSFQKADVALVASLLYVIGGAKQKSFHDDILKMYEVPRLRYDPRLVNLFTWALIRLDDDRGFRLADEILAAWDPAHQESFMHFFSLHDPKTRYDIIRHFVANAGDHVEAVQRVGDALKGSAYDFHEELEYLSLCLDSLSRLKPASAAG